MDCQGHFNGTLSWKAIEEEGEKGMLFLYFSHWCIKAWKQQNIFSSNLLELKAKETILYFKVAMQLH